MCVCVYLIIKKKNQSLWAHTLVFSFITWIFTIPPLLSWNQQPHHQILFLYLVRPPSLSLLGKISCSLLFLHRMKLLIIYIYTHKFALSQLGLVVGVAMVMVVWILIWVWVWLWLWLWLWWWYGWFWFGFGSSDDSVGFESIYI